MANIQDKIGERPQPTGGGMRRVLADGSHSVSELREFMMSLRGRSPQEVLGEVANSSLFRSTAFSAVAFLVVIVGLSAATHYWKQLFPGDKGVPAAVATDAVEPAADAAATPATPAMGPASTETAKSGDPMLDNLGIGESKVSDPKKNPLENSLDNLLDGAK